jgi:uncharacterized repeat protein (TIGR01451 family)
MTAISVNSDDLRMRCRLSKLRMLVAFAVIVVWGGLLAFLLGWLFYAAPVAAATPGAGWTINSFATPTRFAAADNGMCAKSDTALLPSCDTYTVTATNAGSMPTDDSTVTIADTLPVGLTVQRIAFYWSDLARTIPGGEKIDLGGSFCDIATISCSVSSSVFESFGSVQPDGTLRMEIYVTVDEPETPGEVTNVATVSGGGAVEATTSEQSAFGSTSPMFGVHAFSFYPAGGDGAPEAHAGGHPYEVSTRIDFNSMFRNTRGVLGDTSVEDVKDVVVDLPLGLLGSAIAAPRCTFAQLSSEAGCPADTRVGQLLSRPELGALDSVHSGIFNMVPERGVAAEFGYIDTINGSHALFANVVPTPEGYVLRVTSPDVPQVQPFTGVIATFFGNPAAKDGGGGVESAMFTNPAVCTGKPLTATVHVDSWQHPGRFNADGTPDFLDPSWVSATSSLPPVEGCNALAFDPSIGVQPETTAADSPSGLSVDLRVPQSENPGTLATPPLRDAVVRLPEGLTVDPSSANGLASCSLAQIALSSASPPACPEASKVGTLELSTPLLAGTLEGSVYLAAQDENPFGSLLALYVVVDDPATGVVVKIPGKLVLDLNTGRITAVFDDAPELPFSELKLHFKNGPRGVLATPSSCGTFATGTELTPWSAPDSGPPAMLSDPFTISTGCVSGFAPSFTAGSTNPVAGRFAPFALTFSRSDGQEELSGLQMRLPGGLVGKLAGVARCSSAQIAAAERSTGTAQQASPSCPAASLIGTVLAGVGPGPDPFFASGKAYLTGPYKGAPYGVAVIVPALAGPFDLGTVVVRAEIRIDPHTAQVTVTSDPFPRIIDGIPLRLRRVDVTIDRPNFTLNPTRCDPTQVTGALSSTNGAQHPVASRFQVGDCANLAFKPGFKVSTKARHTKRFGAFLHVKITSGRGQANIKSVLVKLPKALPSRVATLKGACSEKQFEVNPAGCPAASRVGTAIVRTPILATPLTGPAMFVSHGGAAFPDLDIVLQGSEITIELEGNTNIRKNITTSNFKSAPDVPISSFELTLPTSPHSALAANGNLCFKTVKKGRHRLRRHVTLIMPTRITGQNGKVLKQNTVVAVQGCGRHR